MRCHAAAIFTAHKRKTGIVFVQYKLDLCVDTIVSGSNSVVLNYTGKVCDVSPYCNEYSPVSNVHIVKANNAWQSPHSKKGEFGVELMMCSTIIYDDAHMPLDKELLEFPHTIISSLTSWNPYTVQLPESWTTLEGMMSIS
eukprot:1345187-Ditylum_brightwellii.AAC.1